MPRELLHADFHRGAAAAGLTSRHTRASRRGLFLVRSGLRLQHARGNLAPAMDLLTEIPAPADGQPDAPRSPLRSVFIRSWSLTRRFSLAPSIKTQATIRRRVRPNGC